MKKTLILLILYAGSNLSIAQTKTEREKKAEKADLIFVKSLFKKMKQLKINAKDTLLWTFTFTDTSITKLQSLSSFLEKQGLSVVEIKTSRYDNQKRELIVSEEKKYSAETLNLRWRKLNEFARENSLDNCRCKIGSETRKGEIAIITYKPVGK